MSLPGRLNVNLKKRKEKGKKGLYAKLLRSGESDKGDGSEREKLEKEMKAVEEQNKL